jgi:hypothetical protein
MRDPTGGAPTAPGNNSLDTGSPEAHSPEATRKNGEYDMAKGQKRSNREQKKPKSPKKKPAAAPSTITAAASRKT